MSTLRTVAPQHVSVSRKDPVDAATLAGAAEIIEDIRARGETALRAHAERLGDRQKHEPLVLDGAVLRSALDALSAQDRGVLERTAQRIEDFARAQKQALAAIDVPVPGGRAGHTIAAVERAGCYAPGGRFPLPSSVLMTAVTARVAGVRDVWVASPRPATVTLAAAAIAGVEHFLAVGGAQSIAALAFGAGPVPAVDVIVGPGNRWVTAAKQLVAGRVGIDMLAGPSELVVLADDSADPSTVAADLLAQAEHDVDALPVLVTTSSDMIARVNVAITERLATLPTRGTAEEAVRRGFSVLCADISEAIDVCNRLAPEHLQVLTREAENVAKGLLHFGGLFIGERSAEVLGDYGIGPNHVLPTGCASRFVGGLSVFHFLRIRTWMQLSDRDIPSLSDAVALARLEGLEGHARAAECRLKG